MVNWGWLIAAFLTGFYFAFAVYGCISAKGQADRCEECYERKVNGMVETLDRKDAELGHAVRAALAEMAKDLCDLDVEAHG